ncbi:MAG: hypothetical protein AB7K37_08235 [Cyclobacteriaceae bacterium]
MKKTSLLVLLIAVMIAFGFATFEINSSNGAKDQPSVQAMTSENSGLTETNEDSW